MKAFFWFFKAWLLVCFGLTFFVAPFYLVAIYPDIPEPYYRFTRSIGYGVIHAEPSFLGFLFRLTSCALVVSLGTLMVWAWLREAGRDKKRGKNGIDAT